MDELNYEPDWTGINIVLPGNSAITGKILNLLKEYGFVEYDFCSLYSRAEGSVAEYYPCPPPRYSAELMEYITSIETEDKENG